MAITVSKRKQPANTSFLKKGTIFYRVKNNGVYVQDFKTKAQAQKYAIKIRKNNR